MGIVSLVRQSCLPSQPDQQKSHPFLDPLSKTISDDYTFFQQENWFRMQATTLFDPNKFIFLFTNYKEMQDRLVNQWKIVDPKKFKNCEKVVWVDEPLQPKWVYAIRRGVPIKYYKNVIELMFARTFNQELSGKRYQTLLYEKLKKNGNKLQSVTFMQQSESIAFSSPFSNKEGIEAAKRISFLLSKTHSQLEYNIYIINVISLLLIFVPQADTYDIVGTMIEGSTSCSQERTESLRWHFMLTGNQLEKFAREFFKTVKDISPSIRIINEHLNTEGIDKFQIFKDVIGDFFIGFLPFPIVLQVFIIYLNEGVKMFYRFFYSILKVTGTAIRDSSNTKQVIRVIRTKLLTSLNTDKQIKQFFRYAFDLQLENLLIRKAEVQLKRKISKKDYGVVYYLPEINGESQILSFQDMQTIWQFLPKVIKHYNCRKIFSSSEPNCNFKKFLYCLQDYNITLLIVQTVNQAVFGIFMAQKLKSLEQLQGLSMCKSTITGQALSDNPILLDMKMKHSSSTTALPNLKQMQHFGSSQNFVFTLRPGCKKYSSTGQNVFYCSYNDDNFVIGGPNPAFQLSSSLEQGMSFSSPTYCNDPLHHGAPGQFKIRLIECFSIQ